MNLDAIELKNRRFDKKIVNLICIFLVNPFLAVPLIFMQIFNKKRAALLALIFLFGILSFLFVPHASSDKSLYLYYHELFGRDEFSVGSFVDLMGRGRPDFLLLFISFLVAKIGLSFSFVAMMATMLTVGIFFYIFDQIANTEHTTRKSYFLGFLLVLLSISLPTLFSGIRFYLAFAISLAGFWFGLKQKKHLIALLLISVAVITHFSSAIYVPIYLVSSLFWKRNYLVLIIYVSSFALVLIPKEFLYGVLSIIGLPTSYQNKVDVYMAGEDVLASKAGATSRTAQIVALVKNAWVLVGVIFILKNFRQVSQLKSLTLIFWSLANLVYSVPTVYNRLMLIPKLLFTFMVVQELEKTNKKKSLYLLLVLWGFSFLSDIMIMRYNIGPSYITPFSVSLISMFFRNITPEDILTW
jgi:hypothetical protein